MKYYPEHQKQRSPLLDLHNFKCVSQIPLDYMHLILQGVVKRMLIFLMKGPKNCRISNNQISEISDRLVSFSGLMPSEFSRQPRSLLEFKFWKATELRQLLLYTGPIVFKSILPKQFYHHFLSLHVAMSILLNDTFIKETEMLNYAEGLLRWFVGRAKLLYGETFTVYNVHNLIHLINDVRTHKVSLNDISAKYLANGHSALPTSSTSKFKVGQIATVDEFELLEEDLSIKENAICFVRTIFNVNFTIML